jgi:hypothetical protein
VIVNVCVPMRGSERMDSRLNPNRGECQNSNTIWIGRSFPADAAIDGCGLPGANRIYAQQRLHAQILHGVGCHPWFGMGLLVPIPRLRTADCGGRYCCKIADLFEGAAGVERVIVRVGNLDEVHGGFDIASFWNQQPAFLIEYALRCRAQCGAWSATRMALAMMVSEGLTALAETKQEASTT